MGMREVRMGVGMGVGGGGGGGGGGMGEGEGAECVRRAAFVLCVCVCVCVRANIHGISKCFFCADPQSKRFCFDVLIVTQTHKYKYTH